MNYAELTDAELIVLNRSGDYDAFLEIYRRFKPNLFNSCFSLIKEETLVEDILQDVFINFWEKREVVDIKTTLGGYLFGMMKFSVTAIFKKNKIKERYLEHTESVYISNKSPDQILIEKELMKKIEIEIQNMPPRQKEIFKLSQTGLYSYREISEILNVSETTIKNQVSLAMKFLRSKFKNHRYKLTYKD